MKKVIILLALSLLTIVGKGQKYPKNSVQLQLMPFQSSQYFDLGLGIRYSRQFHEVLGAYSSVSYVNHRLHNDGYIHDHVRSALGVTYYTNIKRGSSFQFSVYSGVVYSSYGNMHITLPDWDEDVLFRPISFEIGVGTRIFERYILFKNFNCSFSFDFMKNESCINFGYSF